MLDAEKMRANVFCTGCIVLSPAGWMCLQVRSIFVLDAHSVHGALSGAKAVQSDRCTAI